MPPRKRLRRLADLDEGDDRGKEDLEKVNVILETPEKEHSISNFPRRTTRSATKNTTIALQASTTSTVPKHRPVRGTAGVGFAKTNGSTSRPTSPPIARACRKRVSLRSAQAKSAAGPREEVDSNLKKDIYSLVSSDEECDTKNDNKKAVDAVYNSILAISSSSANKPNSSSFVSKKTDSQKPVTSCSASSQKQKAARSKIILAASNLGIYLPTSALSTSNTAASVTRNNYRSITSFVERTVTQHVSKFSPQESSQMPQSHVALAATTIGSLDAETQAKLVGVEKLEDLLDDLSDIDEFTDDEILIPSTQQKKLSSSQAINTTITATQLRVPNSLFRQFRGPSPTGSQSFLLKKPIHSLPQPHSSSLPWPMKHCPSSSSELAIHAKKIAEVSSLLKDLREGNSLKRVLLLKGPTGCGKTVTLQTLAKEGGWDVVEFVNPSSSGFSFPGDTSGVSGSSFISIFEDWLFRSGKWDCLDLAFENAAPSIYPQSDPSSRRKLLLLEDLPNLYHQGTLLSFRSAIRAYLSLPRPPPSDPPIPPLVVIISECSEGAGSSNVMEMSAYKIFGAPILSHPLVAEISFRKVARTLLVKCLEEILRKEGFAQVFEKEILEQLSETGDLRGAISGLEVLLLGREPKSALSQPSVRVGKRKAGARNANGKRNSKKEAEIENNGLLNLLQPRLSTFGLFHSIGKVVYNKRYGDDAADPYVDVPPIPPPELMSYHRYHTRAMKLDPNTILDESGVDANMFIYGVQENYLGSCTSLGGKPGGPHASGEKTLDVLDDVCFCAEALSEGDILMGMNVNRRSGNIEGGISRAGSLGWGTEYSAFDVGAPEGIIRQEEIAAQVVVRGLALGLPAPVKRENAVTRGGKGGGVWASNNKIYYPTGLRLFKRKEDIEELVEVLGLKIRARKCEEIGISGSRAANEIDQDEEGDKGKNSEDLSEQAMALAGLTRAHLVLERLPFMKNIAQFQAQVQNPSNTNYKRQNSTNAMMNKWGIGIFSDSSNHSNRRNDFQLSNTSNNINSNTKKGNNNYGPTRFSSPPPWILYQLEKVTMLKGADIVQADTAEDEDDDFESWKREQHPNGHLHHSNQEAKGNASAGEPAGLASSCLSFDSLALAEDDIVDDWLED